MLVVLGASVWFVVLARWRPWDPRLGAERTALALQAREGGSIRYSCRRMEKDDSSIDMSDVDYFCLPIGHPEEVGFFVGTNSHRITVLRQTG